ncbi:Bug family tripartite tricarboxylate transporter substrate binding protein [Aquabacterium humicola]|uniref:Bug family tripartite tricarboxylate transporter substrate binding protein n=1 Tax=Aquabacterium humicola TaxID=3237377 RepID=UPI002542D549|nr:tripartite tricarboxylate transporter substrate binding protein [Rubrivivax pictus]
MQRRQFLQTSAAAAATAALPATFAQAAWPSGPVRLVVGFPPGGGADALARVVAEKLGTLWKQQVIVENRAGASSALAAEYTAQQPGDGSVLFLSTINSHALLPAVSPKLRYHPERDFTPIVLLGVTPNLLITASNNPVKTVKEVVALCKAKPGEVSFGSAGPATIQHFAIEKFKLLAGVDALHVPYKGSGPLLTDLIGGQVRYTFETMTAATPHLKNGRVIALAQTRGKRSKAYPDVPTMQELGFAGFETMNWYGLSAPAKLPAALVKRINDDVNTVLAMPDVQARFETFGVEDGGGSAERYAQFTRTEIAKWAQVAREAKVSMDS